MQAMAIHGQYPRQVRQECCGPGSDGHRRRWKLTLPPLPTLPTSRCGSSDGLEVKVQVKRHVDKHTKPEARKGGNCR